MSDEMDRHLAIYGIGCKIEAKNIIIEFILNVNHYNMIGGSCLVQLQHYADVHLSIFKPNPSRSVLSCDSSQL